MLAKTFLITLAVFGLALLGLALGAITGRRCVRACANCERCPKGEHARSRRQLPERNE